MKVEAHNLKIENVFSKGQFIIPDYQREYDWGDSEVDEFVEDIDELTPTESYFIGHTVLEGEFNGNTFNVIDGQQRITTITIMLCVIRDLFFERGEEDYGIGINTNYVFRKDKGNKDFVVLKNNMPYPILQAYVQSIPLEKNLSVKPVKNGEKKIVKVYNKLKKRFEEFETTDLVELRDKILNLEIIFVAVSEQVDAFTIFETLNATGKDLTPLDLMKNQIFKLYPTVAHLNEPNDSWKEILKNTEVKGLKFLNNFWASRYRKVSTKKIYKEFVKNIVKKDKDIKPFLTDLLHDSRLFKKISSPTKGDWNIQEEYKIFLSLDAIVNTFSIEIANSILLALLREYEANRISLKYFYKALKTLERFHFINNAINSNRSSGFDIMYAKFSRNILSSKTRKEKHTEIDIMINSLKERIPDKKEFEANFDEKLFYLSNHESQKKLVQYVLRKLEFKRQNRNVELVNMSIEHVFPEKPDQGWAKITDKKLIGNIGNLVLLDSGLNSKIGNKSFTNKQNAIEKKSSILTTKEALKGLKDWGSPEIWSRRKRLVDELFHDVWK